MKQGLKLIISFAIVSPLFALIHQDPRESLDYCLDSRNHKVGKPTQEEELHQACKPWTNRSCCTYETTHMVHGQDMYNFDWNHCRHVKQMSEGCKNHFRQDLCFYECSPNIGPWVQKVEGQKFRNERFYHVPLCKKDCDAWFNSCIEDYTCTNNWGRNFVWKNGRNECPRMSTCKKFGDIFKTAEQFCEEVWDHSWKYTPDEDHCMRLWFNGSVGNPNDAVAKWQVDQYLKKFQYAQSQSSNVPSMSLAFLLFQVFLSWMIRL